ncbi:MAG: hypothetical protein PVH86_10580, partial [Thiogranum sp.]
IQRKTSDQVTYQGRQTRQARPKPENECDANCDDVCLHTAEYPFSVLVGDPGGEYRETPATVTGGAAGQTAALTPPRNDINNI